MLTSSKQVFDTVSKVRKTTEWGLTIDIRATLEVYCHFEICGTGLVRGNQSSADALKKLNGNEILDCLIEICEDDIQVVQWTDRSSVQSSKIATEAEVWFVHRGGQRLVSIELWNICLNRWQRWFRLTKSGDKFAVINCKACTNQIKFQRYHLVMTAL